MTGPISAPDPRHVFSDGSVSAPGPRRRLADRLLDDGLAVARAYASQDHLDPARPTLTVLVAEAIALAERRGEQRVEDGRDTALAALADLVSAVEGVVEVVADWATGDAEARLRGSMDRARRHLDRAGNAQ